MKFTSVIIALLGVTSVAALKISTETSLSGQSHNTGYVCKDVESLFDRRYCYVRNCAVDEEKFLKEKKKEEDWKLGKKEK